MAASNQLGSGLLVEQDVSNTEQPAGNLIAADMNDSSLSKRVILPANCLVMLNGQKCQLKINPESGVLVAYPVKDSITSYGKDSTTAASSIEQTTLNHEDTMQDPPHAECSSNISVSGATQMSVDSNGANDGIPVDGGTGDVGHEQTVEILDTTTTTASIEASSTDSIVTTTHIVSSGKNMERDSNAAQGLLQLSYAAGEEDSESAVTIIKEKLPMPKFIIPAAGGLVTTRAIKQKQVASVTNIDNSIMLPTNIEVTDENQIKPVLRQYLIQPEMDSQEHTSDELANLGVKASGHDLEKLRCEECSYQAYYPQQYDKHLRAFHASDLHKCKCCSFICLVEGELIKHYMDIHPRNICEVCHFVSDHAYVIKRHMYRHTAEGCTCDVCGKTFKDQYILKMHIKMVHMPAEVLYECDVCSKKFTRKAHLKRHQRTHLIEKAHKCPHCEYRGAERSDVTKHMLIHEAPRHSCDVCGKTFRHQKNKDLHMKRHAGQRDYKCGVCDFYGYTFTDIRKHIERRHSEIKTIMCDKCGATFKSEYALQEHRLTWHQAASESSRMLVVEGNTQSTLIVSNDGTILSEEHVQGIDQSGSHGVPGSSAVAFSSVANDGSLEELETSVQEAGEVDTEISDLTITLCQ